MEQLGMATEPKTRKEYKIDQPKDPKTRKSADCYGYLPVESQEWMGRGWIGCR
jgi:hypothetical protein